MAVEEIAEWTQAEARRTHASRARSLTTAGLLAALISVSAWISLPIGAVPVTLQVFVVLLTGLVLPPLWAASAMASYVLLGIAGLPVFSGGGAGLGFLLGPTGGYIAGFLLAAPVIALVRRAVTRGAREPLVGDMLAVMIGIALIYLSGWAWLMHSLDLSGMEAAIAGVGPFVFPDIIKGLVACAAAAALRRGGVVPESA